MGECVCARIMFLLAIASPRSPSPQLLIGRHLCSLLHSLYLIAGNGITCGQPIIKRLMRTYIIITVLLLLLLLLLLL